MNIFASGSAMGLKYTIDLREVRNDRVRVILDVDSVSADTLVFSFPAMVPGTYNVYDFGRFVNEMQASDKDGNAIDIDSVDVNTWRIPNAKKLKQLNYWVDDTFDAEDKKNFVFEPGGSNIDEGSNFVINTHAFLGYFKGMEKQPLKVIVQRPEIMFGASGAKSIPCGVGCDEFNFSDYHFLVDSPFLYCVPDTTTLQIGNTEVLVSVFSPNKKVSSAYVASEVKEILNAQKDYLGGVLPVDRYAFLIYLSDKGSGSHAIGALEHSYSSLYFLIELEPEHIARMLKDFSAHEFFHILTPLNIHSHEIGEFNFSDPVMSKHLWLYEGVTEYNGQHVQVCAGLDSEKDFIKTLMKKMRESTSRYNDSLPFTVMSKGALDKYTKEYGNVYQKGALIGLCLDLELLNQSKGTYNLRNLLADLAKKYGKDVSFNDEELFDEIEKMTYPAIGDFLRRSVDGPDPLPLERVLNYVGYKYERNAVRDEFSLGGWAFNYNRSRRYAITVNDLKSLTKEGRKLKLKVGDEVVKINGIPANYNSMEVIKDELNEKNKEGDKFTLTINRKNSSGEYHVKELSSKLMLKRTEKEHIISRVEAPNESQEKLRKMWLTL